MSIPESVVQQLDPIVNRAAFVTEGGQKSVYRFSHESSDWALKLIDLSNAHRQLGEALNTVVARIQREVNILSAVDSPYIPRLGPLTGRIEQIGSYLVFAYSEEFIAGQSLTALIANGSAGTDLVINVGKNIASALQALWNLRIVHRDVKPSNILQRMNDNSFVLIDPGYALDLAETSLTQTGAIVGTAPYYSPEQLDVNNKRALDCRSDLYSLGIVLCETLTGSHPYYREGMTRQELYSAIRTQSPALPQSAQDLLSILMRLTNKRPHLRYRSPADLLTDLRNCA